ncbi:MAG: arginine repressor [Lachnospiraceae bacterium]|nr:arginine repressor [Lachnospiraceae bacterium]
MKGTRQDKILQLVSENEIETQEELALRLREAGYKVTQATVSRDIRELGLSKVTMISGRQKYAAPDREKRSMNDRLSHLLMESYVSGDTASHIVVIHTLSGMAMALAAAIDAMNIPGLVGCIAGDDTIFCATTGGEEAAKLLADIAEMTGKK